MSCNVSDQHELTYYTIMASAILSLIGTISILISYCYLKSLRMHYFKIVIHISICDGLRAITYIFPRDLQEKTIICYSIGIVGSVFSLGSVLWALLISIVIYQTIVNSVENFDKYTTTWKIIAYILVPLLNLLPISTSSIGINGSFCTFTESIDGDIWRLTLFYFPAWVCNITSIFLFYKVLSKLKSLQIDKERVLLVQRVAYYPATHFVMLILLTAGRIAELFISETCEYFILYAFVYICYAAFGFFNSIIYFYMIRKAYRLEKQQQHNNGLMLLTDSWISNSSKVNLLDA